MQPAAKAPKVKQVLFQAPDFFLGDSPEIESRSRFPVQGRFLGNALLEKAPVNETRRQHAAQHTCQGQKQSLSPQGKQVPGDMGIVPDLDSHPEQQEQDRGKDAFFQTCHAPEFPARITEQDTRQHDTNNLEREHERGLSASQFVQIFAPDFSGNPDLLVTGNEVILPV